MERVIITFLIIETSQEDNVTRIKELLATRDFWGIDQPLHFDILEILRGIQNGQIEAKGLYWLDMEMF